MGLPQSRQLRGWLDREVIQTPDGTPPSALEWACDTCGSQPPVQLAGNRWVRRRCRCERERLAKEATTQKQERLIHQAQENNAASTDPAGQPMTRIGSMMSRRIVPADPPPADLLWSCPTCGPVQPFALPSGRWIRGRCACEQLACQERERQESQQARRHDQLIRTFGGWLGPHWIDREFITAMASRTFDNYDLVRQPEAYEKVFAFAQTLQGNLLLWGDYGTGKTHLEAAVCNYVRDIGWRTAGSNLHPSGSIFVSAPQLFSVYNQTRKAFDQTAHIRFLSSLTGAPLLVIDDVDKKSPREWDWDVYWMVLDARYTARRPTILSTNKRAELARFIGESSLSRLSRGLISVEMRGDDYRREEG